MRIKLRPYHPTFVVVYFGMDGKAEERNFWSGETAYNKDGFDDVIDRIRKNFDIEVELVEQYDDICKKCDRLVEDEKGSIWGKRYTCSSAQDQSVVDQVNAVNRLVLRSLNLQFGSVIKWRDLVKLLSEKIPILDAVQQGTRFQEKYEKGLATLSSFFKRHKE